MWELIQGMWELIQGLNWNRAKNVASTIQSILTSLAIIAGGLWTYYRFIRFRTLKPRFEFSIDLESINYSKDITVAIVAVKASNKGNTKINLRKNDKNRCFLRYELLSPVDLPDALIALDKTSKELKNSEYVFNSHKWIEPSETIDDIKVLNIPTKNSIAIQVELVIYGEQKWAASAAFPLTGNAGYSSFNSEDEQDEYEEAEAFIAEIKTILTKVKRIILISDLSTESKNILITLVDNTMSELNIDIASKIESDDSANRKLQDIRDIISHESFSEESVKTLTVALESISEILIQAAQSGSP